MAFYSRTIRLLTLLVLFAVPTFVGAQTTVTNARVVEFDPSPDHSAQLNGVTVIQRYVLRVYQRGASQPFHTVDMGKPAPQSDGKIRFDFSSTTSAWPAPGGEYESRVAAVGPSGEGVSACSNAFTLSSCSFGLSGSSALFPAAGGGGSVGVTTTSGCSWTLATTVSWITPMTGAGSGPGTATYSVAANTGSSARTTSLNIGGRPYSVTQEGSCSYSISPTTASYQAAGGNGSINVTSATGCAWTATDSASWITVTTTSGTGSRAVGYTVAANTSTSARTGTVTIAGRAHSISQAGTTSTPPPPPPTSGGLPAPWQNQDVGSVGLSGSTTYASGLFTVVGAGSDIWAGADSFHFVRQPVAGDVSMVARVTRVANTHTYAKAGLMVRGSLTNNSAHVILDVRPNGGIEFMTRAVNGGNTTVIATATQAAPAWLRLSRQGSTFTAAVSADGRTWRTVGSRSVSLPSTVQAGLVVTSHTTSTRNTSTFDNVAVSASAPTAPDTGGTLPAPWQTRDIGNVGQAGSVTSSSGLFTVNGAGADIWGTSDSFRFVSQPRLAGGEIVARVTSVENTDPYAKAGIMLRDGLAAGARQVTLSRKPGGGIEFLRRSSTGGGTQYLAGTTQGLPTWLRLVQSGSTVTASVSADGTTWRTVGTTTLTMGTTPLIGLAVTSHDTSVLNTSTFDRVTVR